MAGTTLATNARGLDNPGLNLPTNLKVADVPFQDWARALYNYRQSRLTADDPQELSREEWHDLIKGMIFEGAPVTDDEISLILDYLAANFGKKDR